MTSIPDARRAESRLPIAALRPEVVERIAAGEVIERPASVIRELIENSLDAGASSIRVELRDGGVRLSRVSDNGFGIPADELALAVAPHATSKLCHPADLEHVSTLGFRGEALASIAAVAQVHIVSAVDDSGLGAALIAAPAAQPQRTFEPRPRGTTVTVRDLLQNLPARRTMLNSFRGEERLVLATLRTYALAHPTVQFIVVADGAVLLQTPGGGIESAINAIYGADLARGLVLIAPEPVEGGTLSGWLAPRAFTQANHSHVLLCINGRPVHNHALITAAEAGYRPLLRKGRHPILMATLDIEASLVDVNIHPAKAKVLLHNERNYASALREAIYQSLGQAPAQLPPPLPLALGPYDYARQFPLRMGRRRPGVRLAEPRPHYPSVGFHSPHEPQGPALPPLEPLGQLDNALIVASTQEGHLYLVDQHRAHERLLYEALCRDASLLTPAQPADARSPANSNVQRGQMLLEPLVVELSPRQAEVLASRLDELATLGLACEPFGGSTFLIRALPALPGAANNPAAYAGALAADAAEDASTWREHFSVALACRAALRRGQPLSLREQRALLSDLHTAQVSASCPHGSPILLRYPQSLLARLFEW